MELEEAVRDLEVRCRAYNCDNGMTILLRDMTNGRHRRDADGRFTIKERFECLGKCPLESITMMERSSEARRFAKFRKASRSRVPTAFCAFTRPSFSTRAVLPLQFPLVQVECASTAIRSLVAVRRFSYAVQLRRGVEEEAYRRICTCLEDARAEARRTQICEPDSSRLVSLKISKNDLRNITTFAHVKQFHVVHHHHHSSSMCKTKREEENIEAFEIPRSLAWALPNFMATGCRNLSLKTLSMMYILQANGCNFVRAEEDTCLAAVKACAYLLFGWGWVVWGGVGHG